jgi:hypothetical protein
LRFYLFDRRLNTVQMPFETGFLTIKTGNDLVTELLLKTALFCLYLP